MEIDNTYRKEREDMGLDSILNFFKIPDDFDDEYEEEYVEEPVKAKPVKTQRQPVSQENDYEEPAPKQRSGFLGSKPKVVPMNRTMMEVSIIKPTTFEDSQNICNMLLSGRPVVVNLEGLTRMMHRELWTLYPDVFIQSRDSITRFPNIFSFSHRKM